jgi:dTDP-4-amino-4,6-dideoxygalactose transaminase
MLGANSTLGTLEAAQILSVFKNHKDRHIRRNEIAKIYTDTLHDSYIKPLPYRDTHTWHKFIIDCNGRREEVIEIFNNNGIETKTFYQPLITDELLYKDYPKTNLQQSNYFSNNLLAIPCQSTLTNDEVNFISNVLKVIK